MWLEELVHCSGGWLPCFVLSVLMDVLPAPVLLLTKNKWTTKWIREGPTENGTYFMVTQMKRMLCVVNYRKKIIHIQNVVVF